MVLGHGIHSKVDKPLQVSFAVATQAVHGRAADGALGFVSRLHVDALVQVCSNELG